MKYTVYVSAIRYYETVIEADSKEEAERLFKENRDDGESYEKVKSDIEEEINDRQNHV